ncbi:MAG: hypothetical protein M3Z32_02895 [Acidobacteriota bacterium]|nr:hypothetical protein [Acidobacteriota bacterium]
MTLFYCLIAFDAPQQLFRDSDAGWHIRTGETILNTLTLPRTDPYSFSKAGQPWFAWEWGSDALIAVAHRTAGLGGVVWIFVIAIAAVTWQWFRFNWSVGGNFLFACVLAAPMLSTTNLHWLARPHVFSWMFLLLLLLKFETLRVQFTWRHGVVIAVSTALWANLHASFFFVPLIAMLYGAGHLVRPLLWNLDQKQEWRAARWFGLAALAAVAGSLCNPYGLGLHAHLIEYLGDSELLDRVGEFQSFNFHVAGSGQILFMLSVSAAGGVLALTQKKVGHFLLAAVMIGAALRSARGLPLAALMLLPIANGAITDGLRRARDLRPALRRGLRNFLAYSDRLRLLDARHSGWAIAPVFALLAFGWLQVPLIAARTGFSPAEFPVYAAGELNLLPPGTRLLAPDKYGGYLIYRFAGARKVFFDGRSDFYGSRFMKQYIRLVEVRPGWQELAARWGFTHALLPVEYSLIPALEHTGWKVLFRDEVAVLLQAPQPSLTGPQPSGSRE